MQRGKKTLFLIVIFGLAIIGLLSQIIKEPVNLLISILITIVIACGLFFVLSILNSKRRFVMDDESKKYNNALKQSQRKYKQTYDNKSKNQFQTIKKQRKRRKSHLTVIKGNKLNSKNQMER